MKIKVKILVTCIGGRLVLDMIKAIRDSNDYIPFIIGVDTNSNAKGRLLCDKFFVVPDSERNKNKWIAKILEIHENVGFDLLLTLSEGECLIVSQNKKMFLKRKIKTSVGDKKFLEIISDKYKLMEFLKRKKIHTGTFFSVNNKNQVFETIKKLGYPERRVVLKPRLGRGSRGVLICDKNKAKFKYLLKDRFCGTGNFESINNELIKKKLNFSNYLALPFYSKTIRDIDCLSKKGQILDIVIRKRQLKNPLTPSSTGHMIEMNSKIIEYISLICLVFKINGPCDFDVVFDDNDEPILLDAGSRFSGSVGCSYVAGKNMLAQLIRFLIGIPLKEYKIKNGMVLRPFLTMAGIPEKNMDDLL